MQSSSVNTFKTPRTPAILFVLLSLFILLSCGKTKESNEILIGVYGSMTGTTATFGQSNSQGVQMFIDEQNSKGGVLGKKIRVVVQDDQGKPEEAQTVVSRLINYDHVIAIIGENASSRSLAAAPVCQQSKIPMITPTSTNPKVRKLATTFFGFASSILFKVWSWQNLRRIL